jgi:hypothetical protein
MFHNFLRIKSVLAVDQCHKVCYTISHPFCITFTFAVRSLTLSSKSALYFSYAYVFIDKFRTMVLSIISKLIIERKHAARIGYLRGSQKKRDY